MKALAWISAALLMLFAGVLTLPFSAQGTRVLLALVNETGPVEVEYGGGSLFGDLQLQRLVLSLESVDLQLSDLETRLDLRCFWKSTFCFDRLQLKGLQLDIAAGVADDDGAEPANVDIPFAYRAPGLEIGRVEINWQGGHWHQQSLRADVQVVDSTVRVFSAQLDSPQLEIGGADPAGDEDSGFVPMAIYMPLGLDVDRLQVFDGQFLMGGITQAVPMLALSASWHAYDLVLSELAVTLPGYGQASIRGELAFEQDWPLELQAQFDLALPEQSLLQGRQLQLELHGDLSSLAAELYSSGKPGFVSSMHTNLLAEEIPLSGAVSLDWPDGSTLASLTGQGGIWADLILQGPVRARFAGTLHSQELQLDAQASGAGYQQLQLGGSARWSGSSLDIHSISLTDKASQSQIEASGQINWEKAWRAHARVQSPAWSIPASGETSGGRLSGSVDLALEQAGEDWSLEWKALDITGDVLGLPAQAAGAGGIDSRLQLLPGTTRIELNGARLSVSAEAGGGEQARLAFALDDLGRWLPGARGSLNLQGEGTLGREQLLLEGEAQQLQLQGAVIDSASLAVKYRGEDQQFSLLMRIPSLESAGYKLADLRLDLAGNPAAHRLRISSTGAIEGELSVEGNWSSGQWRGQLLPTRIATGSGDWLLEDPVQLDWSAPHRQLTLAQHCWRHSEFALCAQPVTLGAEGNLKLALSGDIRAFNGLLPRGLRVRGQLDSTLNAVWQADASPQLDLQLSARGIRTTRAYGMGERVSVNWQSIDLSLSRQADSSLSLAAAVQRENRQVLSVSAQLPTDAQGALSGQVIFDGLSLSTLSPWLTQISDLKGQLSGALELAGTPSDPLAFGDLRLTEGRLAAVSNPTVLDELALDFRLQGDRAEVAGIARLGGGELALQGNIVSQPELKLLLTVSGEGHQILLPPASEVLVSEELTLAITESLLDVRGEVRVMEGVLRHEELPAGSVGLSSEVVVVDTQGRVIENGRPFDINADVWLRIRDRFQIEGDGLRATLGGDLHVLALPGEDPQVFGNLNLVGGELEAYRQRLQIRRGTIAFSGPADNPALNMAAEREIRDDNVTVGARLLGSVEEPVLEVYSDPVMSQSEAMSYLVRGRGLDAGAGADGTALALSMGASVVNQSGIVSELNRLPLISDVSFGASGAEDDTAATVSGYIGNRLYLSFGRGLYQPLNVLTARLYLQSRLWLEVVSELENSADLYYSFDID